VGIPPHLLMRGSAVKRLVVVIDVLVKRLITAVVVLAILKVIYDNDMYLIL
jgi:hypothetical protein